MTIGSLFSGVGGLELGLEWAGLGPTLWQVERDAFARRVLARHWPDAERFEDVREVGGGELARVDVICGGFPCQDVSHAGRGEGLAGERSGLWFEFRRIVEELGPRVVVVENVAHAARRWVCRVRRDLHDLCYRTRAYALSAADVGAPHARARVFIVAYDDRVRESQHRALVAQERGRPRDGAPQAGAWQAIPSEGALAHGLPAKLHWERALGNAVVPQCAEVIGRIIAEGEAFR